MFQKVVDPNPSINDLELQAFARRHGIKLPSEYRTFLLANNGGRPVPPAFPIQGFPDNPIGVIQAFFGLKTEIQTEDLDRILDELHGVIPAGILPIANTDGDDFVVLDLRVPGNPCLFWNRKPFWGDNVWRDEDLYPVAGNFQALLATLRNSPY